MRVMISNVGYVLYKLDDREYRNFVAQIDPRYDNPKFKLHRKSDEEPGWRPIFNSDFMSSTGPMRWQGPIQCDTKATMLLLV